MAKKKINTSQPQVSLQRTKQAEPAKLGYGKPPYSRQPRQYSPRGGYGDAQTIRMAAEHPRELLGFTLGRAIGDYFDRRNDKNMYQQEDIAAQNIMNAIQSGNQAYLQSGDDSMRYLANQVGQGVGSSAPSINAAQMMNQGVDMSQEGTERALSEADQEKAARQRDAEVQQAAINLINNGAPVTAAGAKALGLSPTDRQKFYVQDRVAQDYETYGANPNQAKRDEANLAKRADMYSQANLAMMGYDQLRQLIDQHVEPLKTSYRRKQIIKQNLMDRFGKQSEEQAMQQATDVYMSYMQANEEDRQKMMPQMYELQHQLRGVGKNNAAAIVMEPLIQREKQQQALELAQARQQMQMQNYYDRMAYKQAMGIGTGRPRTGRVTVDANGNPVAKTSKTKQKDGRTLLKDRIKDRKALIDSGSLSPDALQRAQAEYDRDNNALAYYDADVKNLNARPVDSDGSLNYDKLMYQCGMMARQTVPKERIKEYVASISDSNEFLLNAIDQDEHLKYVDLGKNQQ